MSDTSDRSECQALLILSCLWGLPALLVPPYWVSQSVVRVSVADSEAVGLVVGWIAATFCTGTLVAALSLRPLCQQQSQPPTLSMWALRGVPAMLAGAIMAAVYSLVQVTSASWSMDPALQREIIFWTLAVGGSLLTVVVGPLFAALTLPIVRRIWPMAAVQE